VAVVAEQGLDHLEDPRVGDGALGQRPTVEHLVAERLPVAVFLLGHALVGGVLVEDAVHTHDLQATILHLLGLDHKRLTYHYQGRDFRLTDVAGEVVKGILA